MSSEYTLDTVEKRIIELMLQMIEEEDDIELKEAITKETQLSDLGINSLSIVKFIVKLEDEYDIEFEDDMLKKGGLQNISALSQYVIEQLESN